MSSNITKVTNTERVSKPLTWAWLIFMGGMVLTPRGWDCIVCGVFLKNSFAIISIILGVAGWAASSQDPIPPSPLSRIRENFWLYTIVLSVAVIIGVIVLKQVLISV